MIIIGEKINGSIPSMAKAIAARDEEWIKNVAKQQAEAGADFIDCCASVDVEEVETLHWMIDLIQSVTDTPISVDSPDARVCVEAMKFCNKPGLINSVSGEGDKIDKIFPILAENKGWQVIALLSDDTGIPKNAADRLKVFDKIMAKAKEYGIAPSRIHIDPLVEMLCKGQQDKADGIGVGKLRAGAGQLLVFGGIVTDYLVADVLQREVVDKRHLRDVLEFFYVTH